MADILFSGEGLHFIVLAAQHANYITISNKKIYYYIINIDFLLLLVTDSRYK